MKPTLPPDELPPREEAVQLREQYDSLAIFVASAAHDLNNILVGVLGNAELARRKVAPESNAQDNLQRLCDSATRAAQLVQALLGRTSQYRDFASEFGSSETTDMIRIPGTLAEAANTVLLVDDDRTMLHVGGAQLKKMGYRVLKAANGQEAIDNYAQNRSEICCVVMDLSMPVMGGLEALARLREQNPTLPALVASGYAESEVPLPTGAPIGFIQKPFRLQALQDKLTEILGADEA